MPTPNLYAEVKAPLFRDLHAELSSTQVELIYFTDRAPKRDDAGKLHYGWERSNSISVGTTVIDLGQNATWQELVEASRTRTRIGKFELRMVSVSEFTRLPPSPYPYRIVGGKVVGGSAVLARIIHGGRRF